MRRRKRRIRKSMKRIKRAKRKGRGIKRILFYREYVSLLINHFRKTCSFSSGHMLKPEEILLLYFSFPENYLCTKS